MVLNILLATTSVVVLVQIALLWRVARAVGTMRRVDERIGHLSDSLALLTEANESGFRAVAVEIERLASLPPARLEPRSPATRIAGATKRGRTVQQIAVDEDLSEGEVRLRMLMADAIRKAPGKARARRTRETAHGALRAD